MISYLPRLIMFDEITDRISELPFSGALEVDIDEDKKIFCLSMPIYSGSALPKEVKKYVDRRAGCAFRPHKTFFGWKRGDVVLSQEVPFGEARESRHMVRQFLELAKGCRKMMVGMAVESHLLDVSLEQ